MGKNLVSYLITSIFTLFPLLSQIPHLQKFAILILQMIREVIRMSEIDMKVIPSYIDDELAILFHFEFKTSQMKVGEATVCTYTLTDSQGIQTAGPKNYRKNKYAVLKDLDIIEDYKLAALKKISHFLKVIGISTLAQDLIA
jgi:hypothetical protein